MGVGRPGTGITSPTKMIANIFVSFIGAGMLGLPFAFKESGILEGALIMAVVGYLSVSAMLMLIDCKYAILTSGGRAGGRSIIMETKVPLIPPDSTEDEDEDERHPPTPSTDLTYGDVGLYAMGPGGKRLVDITIVVSQIGFCCGYLIYICKNLSVYIPRISQRLWLMFLLPPLYCLTLLRHLNKLAIFSLFAQVSNVLALAVVFWFDFSHSEEVPFTPKEVSIKGFPFFFAVSIYCYEGAGMILSLEESMAEHRRHKFRSIFVCTMTGLTLLYICFGVSGYASFGPHTMDIITLNLPHDGHSVVDFAGVVKICLGVALFFTYPMMMFPITHLLDKTFSLHNAPNQGNVVRFLLVGLTGMVVSAVPNFAILMSLIGATCCTLLAFILPAAFHLSIFRQRLTRWQRNFDILLIVLGVLGSIVGLWDAFNRMHGHDPTLAVNEFSSVKNGSVHPPRLLPGDSLASLVVSNLTTAQQTYEAGSSSKQQSITKQPGKHLVVTTAPPVSGKQLDNVTKQQGKKSSSDVTVTGSKPGHSVGSEHKDNQSLTQTTEPSPHKARPASSQVGDNSAIRNSSINQLATQKLLPIAQSQPLPTSDQISSAQTQTPPQKNLSEPPTVPLAKNSLHKEKVVEGEGKSKDSASSLAISSSSTPQEVPSLPSPNSLRKPSVPKNNPKS